MLRTISISFIILTGLVAGIAQSNNKKQISVDEKVPVILIHGIGGSNLRQGNLPKGVFGDGGFPNDVLRGPAGKPKNLQFTTRGVPRSDSMSVTAIADKFYDVPGKNITDLSKYLTSEKQYVKESTLFEFAYDFRFSVEFNAGKLAALIDEIKSSTGQPKVDIVGHSMGGLIGKYYLADAANAANVRTLIFVATPHLGAPKALKALRYGDDLDVLIIDGCKLKRAGHNYPSLYNLLPGKRYFDAVGSGYFIDDDDIDGDGATGLLDFAKTVFNLKFGKETKCRLDTDDYMAGDYPDSPDRLNGDLLERHAIAFHEKLDVWAKPAGVKVFNFVGYNVKTISAIREKAGKVSTETTTAGDGTVPLASAETVESDRTFYIDLEQFKREHSNLIGDERLAKQIAALLDKPESLQIKKTFKAKPGKVDFERSTQPMN